MLSDRENIDFSPDVAPMRRTVWLIYGTALAALLLLLGRNALVSTEGELAESIRNFAVGRNLFLPGEMWYPENGAAFFFGRIGGWLSQLTGYGEWTVRIFAVIPALLLLAGTMNLAEMLFDRRTGAVSGWLLIGSYGFLYWGRHGSFFMLPAAMLIWLSVLLMQPVHGRWDIFALAVLVAAGVMFFGWYFLLPAAALTVLFKRGTAGVPLRSIFILPLLAAVLVFAVVYFLGYVPGRSVADNFAAVVQVVWKTFTGSWQNMVYPGFSGMNWYRTPENLPRLLIPWLPVTLTVIAGMAVRFREMPEHVRKLLISQAVMFVLIGIYPGKRWQYMLPMLPFFMVLTAGGLSGDCGNRNWNRLAGRIMAWGCAVVASVAAAMAVTYPLWNLLLKVYPPLVLIAGVPLMGLAALGLLIFDTGPTSAEERVSGMRGEWSGYILSAVVLSIALWCMGVPSLTKFRTARPFWKKCGTLLKTSPRSEVIFYGNDPDGVELYYLDHPEGITALAAPAELKKYLHTSGVSNPAVIVRQHRYGELKSIMLDAGWKRDVSTELFEGVPLRLLSRQSVGQKHYVMCKFVKNNHTKGNGL